MMNLKLISFLLVAEFLACFASAKLHTCESLDYCADNGMCVASKHGKSGIVLIENNSMGIE